MRCEDSIHCKKNGKGIKRYVQKLQDDEENEEESVSVPLYRLPALWSTPVQESRDFDTCIIISEAAASPLFLFLT